MVLVYKASEKEEALILDNQDPGVRTAKDRSDLIAVYVFQNDGTIFLIKDQGGGKRDLKSKMENKRLKKWLTAKERAKSNTESFIPFNGGRSLMPTWIKDGN